MYLKEKEGDVEVKERVRTKFRRELSYENHWFFATFTIVPLEGG
jgi:hypothetical protein